MQQRHEYPPRVTRGADGVYRWSCLPDRKVLQFGIRLTMAVCGVTVLAFLVMAFVVDAEMWPATLISGASILLIAGIVCLVVNRLGPTPEYYEMSDAQVIRRGATSRDTGYFSLKNTRRVILRENRIDLRGPFGGVWLYVPPEDYAFIQHYIRMRIPETAAIVSK